MEHDIQPPRNKLERRQGVALLFQTDFEVAGYRMKHCIECVTKLT